MKPYKKLPNLSGSEISILAALASKERYGLEIIEAIKKATHGQEVLSLGGLYTTLHRMEAKGLVTSEWGDSTDVRLGARRRYYRITGLGQRALDDSKNILMMTFRLATA